MGGACHCVVHHLAEVFAYLSVFEHDCRVLVNDPLDWQHRAVSSSAEDLEEAALLARVDNLVNGNLALLNLEVEFLLDFILHVNYGLSGDAVHNASVLRGRNQLHVAEARLLQNKNVQSSHFLHIVVKQPKHVIEAISLRVGDVGNEGSHVA